MKTAADSSHDAATRIGSGKVTSRRGLVAVASIVTVAYMGSVVVTPLYPLYQARFGFSELTVTLVYAAYVAGNAVALLVFGQLSDQIGRRRTALPALVTAGLAALIFALAGATVWLFVARVVIGLAVGVASGTATAWIADQLGPKRRSTASVTAAVANLTGIAVGPLLGGLLAQHARWPLQLPFAAYGLLLLAVIVAVARTPDSSADRTRRRDRAPLRLRPTLGLPADLVGAFVAPAVTGFVVFALGGLFFAVVPGLVRRDLGIEDVSISGWIVFVLGLVAVATVLTTRKMTPARATVAGPIGVLPAAALLAGAQGARSLPVLGLAAAVSGATLALGYRGSLQLITELAPAASRAQLTSSYYLAVFAGNSLPIIGIGVLAAVVAPLTATLVFAAVVGALSVAAFAWHRRSSDGHT